MQIEKRELSRGIKSQRLLLRAQEEKKQKTTQ